MPSDSRSRGPFERGGTSNVTPPLFSRCQIFDTEGAMTREKIILGRLIVSCRAGAHLVVLRDGAVESAEG